MSDSILKFKRGKVLFLTDSETGTVTVVRIVGANVQFGKEFDNPVTFYTVHAMDGESGFSTQQVHEGELCESFEDVEEFLMQIEADFPESER